ncbi:hypothetical protein BJY00DRAFT_64911 [Aspergillus carlsbadensis]|nr:hypothetical protein BJY00DRAFT_64911 [Aspergillus carlsbadensis]
MSITFSGFGGFIPSHRRSHQPPFRLLALPFELRLEIYRHVFRIYPALDVRLSPIETSPDTSNVITRTRDYNNILARHDRADIENAIKFRTGKKYTTTLTPPSRSLSPSSTFDLYPSVHSIRFSDSPNTLLALLLTNRQIHAEASKVFYSETFLDLPYGIERTAAFLRAIGPVKTRYIRSLGFEFTSEELFGREGGSNAKAMRMLVRDYLRGVRRLEVIEIFISAYSGIYLDAGRATSGNGDGDDDSTSGAEGTTTTVRPRVFSGLEHLKALKCLRELRVVGRERELMVYEEDKEWFRVFGEENGVKVVFVE